MLTCLAALVFATGDKPGRLAQLVVRNCKLGVAPRVPSIQSVAVLFRNGTISHVAFTSLFLLPLRAHGAITEMSLVHLLFYGLLPPRGRLGRLCYVVRLDQKIPRALATCCSRIVTGDDLSS